MDFPLDMCYSRVVVKEHKTTQKCNINSMVFSIPS